MVSEKGQLLKQATIIVFSGHFVRIAPREVSISDLKAFRAIHKINSGYDKTTWYAQFVDSPYVGIFAMTNAKDHAARRRLLASSFANSNILKYEKAVTGKVQIAVDKIERDAMLGRADVLKWWTFMATDVAGELSFGKSFEMLQRETKTQYIRDLETTMLISGVKSELRPLLVIAKLLPIPSLQSALRLGDRVEVYGQRAIENLKEHQLRNPESNSSLFARFFGSQEKSALSEPEIAAEAGNIIVAGSDTTAVTMTYLTWAILHPRHKHIHQRLVEEVSQLPENSPFSEISKLMYLSNVIDETLRLYGAAPGSLPRAVPPGGAMLGEYHFPEGTVVSTQAFTIHRDPAIFPNPEDFNPERWAAPTQIMKEAFSPFGIGTRSCIGIHLAMLELRVATFKFLKRMPHARLLSPEQADMDMEMENYFLIAPKNHRCEITLQAT